MENHSRGSRAISTSSWQNPLYSQHFLDDDILHWFLWVLSFYGFGHRLNRIPVRLIFCVIWRCCYFPHELSLLSLLPKLCNYKGERQCTLYSMVSRKTLAWAVGLVLSDAIACDRRISEGPAIWYCYVYRFRLCVIFPHVYLRFHKESHRSGQRAGKTSIYLVWY